MSIPYETIIAIDITSKAIDITLLDDENINVKSYFKPGVHVDPNSWGVRLVTGIASYVHALPLPSGLDDAFDMASSLERKVEIPVNSPHLHRQIEKAKIISHFFGGTFFSSCFDRTSISVWILFRRFNKRNLVKLFQCPISGIITDDIGAYVKTRNTTKLNCQVGDERKGVCEENGKFYYNVNSLITHLKENKYCLITSFCTNEVIVRPKASL